MDKTKKNKLIILIVFLTALASIVFSLNRYICLPWVTGITVSEPIAVQSDGRNTVVLDMDLRSMIILNENGKIQNKVSLGSLNENLCFAPSMVMLDGSCYAPVRNYFTYSAVLRNEEVVKYDLSGDKSESVFTCGYDEEEHKFLQPKILGLFEKDGECHAIVVNEDKDAVGVRNVSDVSGETSAYSGIPFDMQINSQVPIAMAWYDRTRDSIYVMDQYGKAYAASFGSTGPMVESSDFESEDYYRSLYANSVLWVDGKAGEGILVGAPEFFDSRYDYITHKPAEIRAVEGRRFSNDIWVQLRIWMFWLGIIIIAGFAVCLIVKGIRKSVASGNLHQLKKTGLVVAAGLACLIIVIFYSYHLISITVEHDAAAQRTMIRMVKRETEALVVKARNEIAAEGEIDPKTYKEIASILDSSSYYASQEEMVSGYHLALIENEKAYSIYFSTANMLSALCWRDVSRALELDLNAVTTYSSKSFWGGFVASNVFYTDESGKAIGSLYVYTDIVTVTAYFIRTCIDLFIKLFVGGLVIVYAVMEAIAWKTGFHRRRLLKQEGIDFSGTALARPMFFLATGITAADASIVVLIIKDMLRGTAYDGNLMLYTLPMVATSAGFFISGIISNYLFERRNIKRVLFISAVAAAGGLITETWSAYSNNISLLLISRFFVSACSFTSGYYAKGYSGAAPNDDLSRECAMGITASKISSYALISVVTGYTCVLFGNYTVYLVSLVLAIMQLTIIICNTFEDRKSGSAGGMSESSGIREQLKFLLSPPVLILIVFGMFVVCFIDGYKTYVFPLFADKGGISKASISNIQVFAKAIVYFSLPMSMAYQKRVGSNNMIIINMLVIAGMFFLFLLNQSVIWAVVLLIVINCAGKGIDTGIMLWWQDYAKKNKINMQMAHFVMNNAEQVINIIKTPILGWLFGFGQAVSCLIIGVYLVLSSFMLKISDKIQNKGYRQTDLF